MYGPAVLLPTKKALKSFMALQVQATRALLRALQHLPSFRTLWGLHNAEPIQALLETKEPDVRWLAIECLALLAKLVSCYSPLCCLELHALLAGELLGRCLMYLVLSASCMLWAEE